MRLFRARYRNAETRLGDGNLLWVRTVASSRKGSFGHLLGR
jgi:hypothetical protein